MKTNTVQIGKMFEDEAEKILEQEGFLNIIKDNHQSPYDFTAIKNDEKYYIEVRGRRKKAKTDFFVFTKKKLNRLRKLKNVILLLINEGKRHVIFPIQNIKKHSSPIWLNKTVVYVIKGNNDKAIINKKNREYRIKKRDALLKKQREKRLCSKVSPKYQITLKKSVREAFNIRPGQRVMFSMEISESGKRLILHFEG